MSLGSPFNPALGTYTYFSKPYFRSHDTREQTYGLTLTYAVTSNWQHQLVLGYDAKLEDFFQNQPRFVTPADSLLYDFNRDDAKTSVAYNTTYAFPLGRGVQSSLPR